MDQIEGGTLVVNSATSDDKPKETDEADDEVRNLNVIDGLSEGWKLAEVRAQQTRLLRESRLTGARACSRASSI